jgi:hypothetical protein
MENNMNEQFETGQLVATAAVTSKMKSDEDFYRFCITSFYRHKKGDWGDTSNDDKQLNNDALVNGDRVFSVYYYKGNPGERIWIITEADRSTTTILFPSDY